MLSFYAGYQKVLITPYKSDLGLQLVCTADLVFKDIIADNFFLETKTAKKGVKLYKKLQISTVEVQNVGNTFLISFYGKLNPGQHLVTVATYIVFFSGKTSKIVPWKGVLKLRACYLASKDTFFAMSAKSGLIRVQYQSKEPYFAEEVVSKSARSASGVNRLKNGKYSDVVDCEINLCKIAYDRLKGVLLDWESLVES